MNTQMHEMPAKEQLLSEFPQIGIDLNGYKPWPRNYNQHPQVQIEALAESLKTFGQPKNIVVWNGYIVDGHGLVEAAQSLGWATLRANQIPAHWDEVKVEAFLVAANELAKMADPDKAKLSALLADMNQNGINLKAVGWDSNRLDELLAEVRASVEPTPDNDMDAEPQMDKGEELKEKWAVSQGDIWALGNHRLLCGDCTDAHNINQLMNGEQIVMVMTSPPYAAQRDYEIGDFDWDQLMNGASSQWFRHMKPDGNALINLGLIYGNRRPMLYWEDWLQFCDTQLGWPLFGLYVWDKLSGLPGDWNGRLAPSFEFVFHFNNQRGIVNKWVEKKEESIIAKNPDRTALRNKDGTVKKMTTPEASLSPTKIPDDVIRIHREYVRDIHTEVHPAVYPVAFPVYLIQTWTRIGDIVYEPFLGSGTTLMAAEQLGRRCYGCELEPKYVAVALERWHMATGKMPMRLE